MLHACEVCGHPVAHDTEKCSFCGSPEHSRRTSQEFLAVRRRWKIVIDLGLLLLLVAVLLYAKLSAS